MPLDEIDDDTCDHMVDKLQGIRSDIQEKTKSNISVSQAKQKMYHNQKRMKLKTSFIVGDRVLLYNTRKTTRKGGKREKKLLGPYLIDELLSKRCVKLKPLK